MGHMTSGEFRGRSLQMTSGDIRGPQNLVVSNECQITHLIRACLKYDLYDFFRGVLGLLPVLFLILKGPKTPPKKVI